MKLSNSLCNNDTSIRVCSNIPDYMFMKFGSPHKITLSILKESFITFL